MAVERVLAAINWARDGFSYSEIREPGNVLLVLSVGGLRNHRDEP